MAGRGLPDDGPGGHRRRRAIAGGAIYIYITVGSLLWGRRLDSGATARATPIPLTGRRPPCSATDAGFAAPGTFVLAMVFLAVLRPVLLHQLEVSVHGLGPELRTVQRRPLLERGGPRDHAGADGAGLVQAAHRHDDHVDGAGRLRRHARTRGERGAAVGAVARGAGFVGRAPAPSTSTTSTKPTG